MLLLMLRSLGITRLCCGKKADMSAARQANPHSVSHLRPLSHLLSLTISWLKRSSLPHYLQPWAQH